MLHIARQSDRCCGTCQNWNGVRVMEGDGHVYSVANIEAACGHLWEAGKSDPCCVPLTLPSDGACPDWVGCEAVPSTALPEERRLSPRTEGLWLAAKALGKPAKL